jgi:hypothetical protein
MSGFEEMMSRLAVVNVSHDYIIVERGQRGEMGKSKSHASQQSHCESLVLCGGTADIGGILGRCVAFRYGLPCRGDVAFRRRLFRAVWHSGTGFRAV